VAIEVLAKNVDLASLGLGDQSQNEELKKMLADRRSAMHMDIQYFDFGTAVSTASPTPPRSSRARCRSTSRAEN